MIKGTDLQDLGFEQIDKSNFEKKCDGNHVIPWHDYKIIKIWKSQYLFRINIRSLSSHDDVTEQVFLGQLETIEEFNFILDKVI